MAWTTELGPIQTFALGSTIPIGWWFSTNDFSAIFDGVYAQIGAGQHFYSDGTATVDPGVGGPARVQQFLFEPGTQGPPIADATVPPSVPGITQPVFDSGSATNPAPPIHITGSPLIPTSVAPGLTGTGQIGNPTGVPVFPPPTPPPIGEVPVGPLVGPAVAPAPVPPSVAGYVQPRFWPPTSATSPTAASLFPAFTTTTAYAGFPNQPPNGVPIVFANIWNIATMSAGAWVMNAPPSTPTVAQIILDGWGLPGPQNGVGPPVYPHPPGTGLPYVGELRDGHEEFSERSSGSVLSGDDPPPLHQSSPPKNSRRKRLLAGDPGGSTNGT